jgi:NAD+ kinase
MIRKVVLHHNPSKKRAVQTRDRIIRFLRGRGVEVLGRQDGSMAKWGETRIPHFTYGDRCARAKFGIGEDAKRLMGLKDFQGKDADMLLTIGGDGTMLFYKALYDLPIFAVGSRTSFLCQARMDNWKPVLSRVLGSPEVETNPMLEAGFGRHATEPAINEVCVKNPRHRMLTFRLRAGKRIFSFGADGVIFSTPLGSSGYAYSAGGKEFSTPGCIGIVPVAPHRRLFKPMLVRDDAPLSLRIVSRHRHELVDVVIDGQMIYRMGLKADLLIRKSGRSFRRFKVVR